MSEHSSETAWPERVEVAVVGCGTTGLTLARLLGMEGVTVAAIDPFAVPRSFPRATHLDDDTMRTFQTLGLSYLEPGFSLGGVYRTFDPQWRPVMEFAFNGGQTDQGWLSDYMFHQPDFEAILRGHVHSDPRATHFFGWTVTGLTPTADGVDLTLHERSSGREQVLSAGYVVGCDGANSFVRAAMGGSQVNYHATHRSLIVDILPFETNEKLAGRDAFIHAGIRNPLTFVPMSEPLFRFEELLRPDDDTAEFERMGHVYDLISPWLRPDQYRVLRADVYEWDAVVAEPWANGRILVAGDAAHEMPPHLGQGMASGIRDAMNLGWKLARVLRGDSDAALLDTYESERGPHVTVFVELAAQLANQVEAMEARPDENAEVPVTIMEPLRPRLGAGVWIDGDDPAGFLSAQPTLANGRLDDLAGYRFALLATAQCLAETDAATQALLDALDVRVLTADSDQALEWLKRLDRVAVVLRPDRYIFGSADEPALLAGVVERLARALTSMSDRVADV